MDTTDLVLYTDGSGHQDGFSGYAALVKTPDETVRKFVMGSMSLSSVDRAEFTALIEGLRVAMDTWMSFPEAWEGEWPEERVLLRPSITWYSDRESLVLSVKRVNGRSNCPDLWAAFEHFEKQADITANFISEDVAESLPDFVECDLQSSTGRIIMKSYYQATPLVVDRDISADKAAEKLKKKQEKENGKSTP